MQWIVAIVSFALLMCVEAANAQSAYSLSVTRHSKVPPLSKAEVNKILADASKMLQENPGSPHDVTCNVSFTLKGPVGTFADPPSIRPPDTLAIVTEQNIAAVNKVDSNVKGVDFHVKVVEQIKFCRPGVLGNQAGCAFSPPDFRSVIVVHPARHVDPLSTSDPPALLRKGVFPDHLLWAHEFGHLTGLGHRENVGNDDDKIALMTRCNLYSQFLNRPDKRVLVSQDECRHLRAGPGHPSPGPFPIAAVCRNPRVDP